MLQLHKASDRNNHDSNAKSSGNIIPKKWSNYAKPPLIVYNRPRYFNNFDKLEFIIDGDDETRYSDNKYVQYLRTGKTIYKDETRETTIRFLASMTPSASQTETETTWNIITIRHTPVLYQEDGNDKEEFNSTMYNASYSYQEDDDDIENLYTFSTTALTNSYNFGYNASSQDIDDNFVDINGFKTYNITFTIKSSELKRCYEELRIVKSPELVLVYNCYYWTGGLNIFLISSAALLCIFYTVVPMILAKMKISNIQEEKYISAGPKVQLLSKFFFL